MVDANAIILGGERLSNCSDKFVSVSEVIDEVSSDAEIEDHLQTQVMKGANRRLLPFLECAHVEQWIDFASLEIDANILNWFRPRTGRTVYLPPAEEAVISALKRGLGALNTNLASNTCLVGHAVTLADIIITCNLHSGFTRVMTTNFT
ncbi:hypothetical protein LOK49_LG04G00637 [Camellia lanceoleosa]|uniref:Uncharacterized protein n=1 Tax=Camellia lanceoleosa TaxID=1840588 RepID=A0ACC0HXR5_9ERIC|nr:hypothetical protein LOK49_LG04G00637 [Camellia lanceoleosa]